MLEPEYFNYKADRVVEIYQEWEDFLMRDIANRVLKTEDMSGTVDYELWVLEQMGEHRDETLKKLSALTDMSVAALRAVLQDAVLTSWKTDRDIYEAMGIVPSNPIENPAVMKVIDAEYRKGVRELHNLTQTTMNQSQQDLIRMLDEAELRLTTGAKSAASEVCRILDEYAGHGIYVTYPSGTKRTLEAAVRMCVVTSMNQLAAAITNQYIVEHKIEYVIVSAHLGARTQPKGAPYCAGHINWQGRVYKIRGSDDYAPNLLEMTGYDIGEHGENRVADLRGLHGYNCRHSHGPWIKGLENTHMDADGKPKIGLEENKARYDLEQKQRAMERAIRKTKRELLMKRQEIASVAETDVKDVLQPGYDKLAYKLRQQNKAYNEFCEKHDLPKQADRTKVSGYTRKEAAKAVGRATAYENQQNSGKSSEGHGIIQTSKSYNRGKEPMIENIEQRNTGRGNPSAITHFGRKLNNRQSMILKQLSQYDSQCIIPKKNISMSDLAALTAETGDEFAMFTKGNERLIIRGNHISVNVNEKMAIELKLQGYRWSGHTHPGVDELCLLASEGDLKILSIFDQEYTAIYNSLGKYSVVEKEV